MATSGSILKAIGAAGRKGSGLRDYRFPGFIMGRGERGEGRKGLVNNSTPARVSVQSSSERVRGSWNLAEGSRQCCVCSLSSAPLPCRGQSGLMVRVSDY